MKLIANVIVILAKIRTRLMRILLRPAFRACGQNFVFDSASRFSYNTIEVGNDVFIGPGATLLATDSEIIIGNKVMFGPNVTIIGGDHNSSVVGKYMIDVKEKRPEDDLPVIIEDDVWIGANALILKGVTIGRGSIVAAGAVVTKTVAPYAIVAGVPARTIASRFNEDTIHRHEQILYTDIADSFVD